MKTISRTVRHVLPLLLGILPGIACAGNEANEATDHPVQPGMAATSSQPANVTTNATTVGQRSSVEAFFSTLRGEGINDKTNYNDPKD